MAAKFALKKSKNGKFFFNLLATNGQAILASEMYEAKPSALNGIESVRKNGIVEARFEKLNAKDGSPYFTLKATNGQVIGQSEMYTTTAARDNGIASVMKNAAEAVLDDQTTASA
ncbi:YegP family protein [Comamonas sp. NoAH]|uniref:YegP family protein n=1 Tax=Comamonas halotolerans TaxID=3041496 RepID=UPI0024E17A7D|nr:YegP family protein [Comamonas sp. NoAH]